MHCSLANAITVLSRHYVLTSRTHISSKHPARNKDTMRRYVYWFLLALKTFQTGTFTSHNWSSNLEN